MGAIKWLFNQHQFLQLAALTTKTVTVKAVLDFLMNRKSC